MKLFFGSLLTAIVVFGWGYVSWEMLGWHQNNISGFKNEAEVAEVLKKNVEAVQGIYMLPHQAEVPSFLPPGEKELRARKLQSDRNEGPFVYAVIRPGKKPFDMNMAMAWSFLRAFLASLVLASLLHQTSLPYVGKVVFCAAAGTFAGIAAQMPDWIWFEWTGGNLFVAMADLLFEWTLAGLVLAGFVGKPQMILS